MKRLLKEYLLENWTLKITAVLLSLILWLFVRGEPGQEKYISGVPLEVRVPPNMEISDEHPTSVDVTMTVAAFSDMLIGQPRPTCTIDLQGFKEGEHNITLTTDNIKIPRGSGIEVTKVSPQRVTLVLERTVSKEVPLVVPVAGEPAHGYEVYGKSSRLSNLVITGPRSHIESISEISTETVSVAGLKQPAHFFLVLNVKDKTIRTNLTTPLQVDVQIGPRRKLATVAEVPVGINDLSYAIFPNQITVQVLAPVDSIANLTPADFSAFISASSLDLSRLPVKTKPQVRIENSKLAGTAIIKDCYPPEVTVRKKPK